jgi:electron transfer flavoprotein beta subunit
MNILVCISCVPDTTTKVRFTGNNTSFDSNGVQWIINPWDELALTRALELKEDPSCGVTGISVVTVGRADTEPVIRKALAIGADDAWRIDAEPADAFFVASQIAGLVQKESFDVIMCGIESSDHNGSTVGGMMAELLDRPSVSAVSGLMVENGKLLINRDIDGGKEQLTVAVPVVLVVQKGIAREPRIAAMRGIMMARKKPLQVLPPVEADVMTETVGFEMPPAKQACKMVDPSNIRELVDLLQNEAKVL